VIPTRPESSPALSESPDNLSIFKEMLGLIPNRAVMPVEEENLGLAGVILIYLRPPGSLPRGITTLYKFL